MSIDLGFYCGGPQVIEYTVREENGCTFIFGESLPSHVFTALRGGESAKGKIMSPHLARLACALFAWGTPQDVAAAIEKYTPIALARTKEYITPEMRAMGDEAIRWLAIGQHGMSSCSIFWKTTGFKPALILLVEDPRGRYPADPDDLGRCRLLLEQVPYVRDRFQIMEHFGPIWEAFVEHWDALCATMDEEAPEWREDKGSAPKTGKMMDDIVRSAALI